MASIINYVADGTTQAFTIPFLYISTSEVKVFLDDVPCYDYTLTTSSTITLDVIPSSGVYVTIKRQTIVPAAVTFVEGTSLRADDLNLITKQGRNLAEEARDRADEGLTQTAAGLLNAQSKKISNVSNPVSLSLIHI